MTGSPDLTRETMEAASAAGGLITVPEYDLDAISDPDAREALRTLGMPRRPTPWLSVDSGGGAGFTRIGDLLDWDLADRYDPVPPGAERWIHLGSIHYDLMALDPDTGKVHCLPQDAEIYPLNTALRHFIHFLYVLQTERPHYDLAWEGDEALDLQGARRRLEATMRSVDPAALEDPESLWFSVLNSVEDPDWEYY